MQSLVRVCTILFILTAKVLYYEHSISICVCTIFCTCFFSTRLCVDFRTQEFCYIHRCYIMEKFHWGNFFYNHSRAQKFNMLNLWIDNFACQLCLTTVKFNSCEKIYLPKFLCNTSRLDLVDLLKIFSGEKVLLLHSNLQQNVGWEKR